MSDILYVILGGAVGAALRFMTYNYWYSKTIDIITEIGESGHELQVLNLPTIWINIAACFLFGLLLQPLSTHRSLSLLLLTGVLGAFSTFSTFGFEAYSLFESGLHIAFLVYILFSVIGGLVIFYLGSFITG